MGTRWLSDDVLNTVFELIIRKHDDTICSVCKSTWIMYSFARMSTVRDNSITISKVIVVLNVGCADD